MKTQHILMILLCSWGLFSSSAAQSTRLDSMHCSTEFQQLWLPEYYTYWTYTDSLILQRRITEYDLLFETFYPTELEDYEYTPFGGLSEQILSFWSGFAWERYSNNTFTYTSENLVEIHIQSFDLGNNEWVPSRMDSSSYYPDGSLESQTHSLHDGDKWVPLNRSFWKYHQSGGVTLDSQLVYEAGTEIWHNSSLTQNTCNLQDQLSLQLSNYWNSGNNEWVKDKRKSYYYDILDQDSLTETSLWNTVSADWDLNKLVESYWNNGHLTQKISFLYDQLDSTYHPTDQYVFEWQDSLLLSTRYQAYEDSIWRNFYIVNYDYDEYGRRYYRHSQSIANGIDTTNQQKCTSFFQQDGTLDLNKHHFIEFLPNPLQLGVLYEIPPEMQVTSLRITAMDGRLIHESKNPRELRLPETISPGYYVIALHDQITGWQYGKFLITE